MKRAEVGSTGVAVTALGFGGATIGNLYRPIDDETAHAAVAAAWDGGVRYFDTAPHYGLGLSERRLGRALQGRPRDQYTLSTKVGRLLAPNPSPAGSDLNTGGFAVPDDLVRVRSYSRDGVLRSIESSLERLGLDRIDIVYVHDPEDYMDAAIAEAVPALVELRQQRVVGAVGAGMNYVEPLRRFVAEADVDVVMVAGRWTLVDRRAEPLLSESSEADVGVVAAAPFNSGLLARRQPAEDAMFDYDRAPADVLEVARACARACESRGAELPAAALQFPLRHPAVVSVVAGMRTPAQVDTNLAWINAEIDARLWSELPAPARPDGG
ncbi:MAG: aldo/keto reductase [Solirubrobacteraceae bacterium]